MKYILFCNTTSRVNLWCRIREDEYDGDCLMYMVEGDLDPADFPAMKPVCTSSPFQQCTTFQHLRTVLHQAHWKKFWAKLKNVQANGVTMAPPTSSSAAAVPPTPPAVNDKVRQPTIVTEMVTGEGDMCHR